MARAYMTVHHAHLHHIARVPCTQVSPTGSLDHPHVMGTTHVTVQSGVSNSAGFGQHKEDTDRIPSEGIGSAQATSLAQVPASAPQGISTVRGQCVCMVRDRMFQLQVLSLTCLPSCNQSLATL